MTPGCAKRFALIVFASVVISGCIPLVTRNDPVRVQSARFVDRITGTMVSEVLVVPRFVARSGVATGHGQGNMSADARIAEPRLQRSGETLVLSTGSVVGLWLPFVVMTGRYVSLDGVLIIAAGYHSSWVEHPHAKGVFEPLFLTPIGSIEEAVAELRAIGDLFGRDSLTTDEARRVGILSTTAVGIHFDANERKTVDDFVKTGLARFRARAGIVVRSTPVVAQDRLNSRWSGRATRAAQRERYPA